MPKNSSCQNEVNYYFRRKSFWKCFLCAAGKPSKSHTAARWTCSDWCVCRNEKRLECHNIQLRKNVLVTRFNATASVNTSGNRNKFMTFWSHSRPKENVVTQGNLWAKDKAVLKSCVAWERRSWMLFTAPQRCLFDVWHWKFQMSSRARHLQFLRHFYFQEDQAMPAMRFSIKAWKGNMVEPNPPYLIEIFKKHKATPSN